MPGFRLGRIQVLAPDAHIDAGAAKQSSAGRGFEALSVQRRAAPLARSLDDSHRSQTVRRPLGEQHATTKQRGQLTRAERLRRERRQRSHHVARPAELDAVEHIDQASLPWIPSPASHRLRSSAANVVLAQQQHLDRQVRVG